MQENKFLSPEYLYLYLQEINSIIQTKKKIGAADRAYVGMIDSKEGAAKLSCIYNRTVVGFCEYLCASRDTDLY